MTLGQTTAGRDLKVRYLYLGGFMLLGLLLLAGRLYRLQVTRGEEFVARSVENFVKQVRIPADRGMILDANGRILVDSRPSFDVFVTPAFCIQCRDEVLPKLARHLQWDASQLQEAERLIGRARRDAPFRPIAVRIDVPRELADFLEAHRVDLPGVDVLANPHRNYRTGEVLSHVVGYMNEITQEELDRLNGSGGNYLMGDYIGRQGIEKAFESWLRGKDGERKQVVDARGQPIPGLSELVGGGNVVEPTPGHNVVLSIDMRLQEEADRVFPGRAGAVVVVEVKTGFVLALLSRPGYDPNLLTGRISAQQLGLLSMNEYKPLMNRVTQMHYPPGSVWKVVTGLAALREKVLSPHTHVNCPGGYRLGRRVWRCHKESGHGPKDARTAMQASCDTYYWRAADLMGIDAIAREARELGFGQPTGITGLLEVPGIVPDTAYHDRVTPGGYQKGMALNAAIGQGDVTVTPIQIVMAYAAIANGGTLYRPQLVRRIESRDGTVLQTFEPEVVRQVDMPAEHRAVIAEGLRMVVNEPGGTAYWRRIKEVEVAGKTGTAQVAKLGARRLKTEEMDYWVRDHAWFAAFAPARDPEIAVVVLNEHGGHGGSDAAPTAMAVIRKYFELKQQAQEAPAVATPVAEVGDGVGGLPVVAQVPARAVTSAAEPTPAPVREEASAPVVAGPAAQGEASRSSRAVAEPAGPRRAPEPSTTAAVPPDQAPAAAKTASEPAAPRPAPERAATGDMDPAPRAASESQPQPPAADTRPSAAKPQISPASAPAATELGTPAPDDAPVRPTAEESDEEEQDADSDANPAKPQRKKPLTPSTEPSGTPAAAPESAPVEAP